MGQKEREDIEKKRIYEIWSMWDINGSLTEEAKARIFKGVRYGR